MEVRCVICGISDNLGRRKGQGFLNVGEFKKGFGLFCKLLINSSSDERGQSKNGTVKEERVVSGDCGDDLLSSLISGETSYESGDGEGEDCTPPNCCKSCCKALEEVIRLEKVIQDIRLSQLVHVNTLKEALISSKPIDDDPQNSFWKQVTNQLINKCFPSLSSESQVKRNEKGPGPAKRQKLDIFTKHSSSGSTSHSSRLPTDTSHSQSPPCRQSKLRACKNLRNLSTQPASQEEEDYDPDHQSRSSTSANDNDDHDEDFTPIKEEPQDQDIDDDNEDYDHFNDLKDNSTNCPEPEEESESEDDPVPPKSSRRTRSSKSNQNPPQRHTEHNVYLISSEPENLYIFKNTFLKYSPISRQFLCQSSSCPTPIITRTFTESDIQSIKTHVTTHHQFSSSPTPSKNATLLRCCPQCSKSFPCISYKSERLFTAHLHSCYGNKHIITLCTICSKPCLYVDRLMHFWSHKNTQDKITAIKSNSPIPSQWRRRVLSRKGKARSRDPFYSLITGQPQIQPETEKKTVDPDPPKKLKKFRKNTPESVAQRTCPKCSKVFKYIAHMRSHMATHIPEPSRPHFDCPHCSKKLMSSNTLRNHLERVHRAEGGDGNSQVNCSKDVMIQCSQCPQQFYHRDTTLIKAHMRMHEGGDTPFICDQCGKGFWWRRYLEKHREVHNEDRVECNKCSKSFKQRKYLLRHLKKCSLKP